MRSKIVSGVDLYVGCVYIPTQGNIKHLCTNRFKLLEEDMCMFQSKGQVLLLGDFNTRVDKSENVNDIIEMTGENIHTCNSNGNLLIELLQYCNIMVCNGRTLLSDPQSTQVQSHLGHKSIIDYIITDKAL